MFAAYILLASSGGAAGIERGRLGIGLNYPGVGIRYLITDNLGAEARGQYEEDAHFGGVRACWYFSGTANVYPYAGVEGGYAGYEGAAARAGGYALSLFLGGEYFMWPDVSAQFDFGPAYVGLEDGDTSISVSGIEFAVNFGLTYYFGKR